MNSRIYIFFITESAKTPREFCNTSEADGSNLYFYFLWNIITYEYYS